MKTTFANCLLLARPWHSTLATIQTQRYCFIGWFLCIGLVHLVAHGVLVCVCFAVFVQDLNDEEINGEPMYFKTSSQLLNIFGNLEERNLFLIQNCQETEEKTEELKQQFEDTRISMCVKRGCFSFSFSGVCLDSNELCLWAVFQVGEKRGPAAHLSGVAGQNCCRKRTRRRLACPNVGQQ